MTPDRTDDGAVARAVPVVANWDRLASLMHRGPMVLHARECAAPFALQFVSDNVKDIFGYTPAQVTGSPGFWIERVHPEDLARVLSDLVRLGTEHESCVLYRFRYADGRYRWTREHQVLLHDARGAPTEIVGHWLDIRTEAAAGEARARAERKRDEALRRLNSLRSQLAQESDRRRAGQRRQDELAREIAALGTRLEEALRASDPLPALQEAHATVRALEARIRASAETARPAAAGSDDPYDRITPREQQVLHLAAEGYGNAEVGAMLGISPRTAEVHRANLMRKLGLTGHPALIQFALRRGILFPID